ncbi:MAG TPA: HD domain-containing phosphohydrolase [Tepidisphaeraceae bacterium]
MSVPREALTGQVCWPMQSPTDQEKIVDIVDQERAITGKGISFSEVISALSYALDITEGQPVGHAARSCLIGMRIAQELSLSRAEQSALFYGLLLKDLGCSSNASKVCSLFGSDDRTVKRDLKTTNWTKMIDSVGYLFRNAVLGSSVWRKISRVAVLASEGQSTARELVQIRCDRGAKIARDLLLPEMTAVAIHSLDEHWNGYGYPDGLTGDRIPRLARVMNLAQTIEVFWHRDGIDAACDMAVDRSGSWFDPEMVGAFLGLRNDPELHENFQAADAATAAAAVEPPDLTLPAGDDQLERLALGFSEVVDAKSPWTYEHSRGVARLSEGMGAILDISGRRLRKLRWAALLHDIGKLGVSNLILDKPAKLNAEELVQMRKHTSYTHEILRRVQGFAEFAEMAAGHHERIDGRGYHRGISGDEISLEMRILAVADMYEALAAKRPYRQEKTTEEALTIIARETGSGLCPIVVAALRTFLAQNRFVPYQVAA